jgi:hypothetical protein
VAIVDQEEIDHIFEKFYQAKNQWHSVQGAAWVCQQRKRLSRRRGEPFVLSATLDMDPS